MKTMETSDVLVVGAGISGLLCATELQRAGRSAVVLDKGRGPGGRMATRRMGGGRVDHGAQYFTAREERFKEYVAAWQAAGVIREWFRHAEGDSEPNGYPRFCGVTGISDVAKYLAGGLQVRLSEQVVAVDRVQGEWVVQTQSGAAYAAKYLVMTAPLPQTLNLLDTTGLNYAGEQRAALGAVSYEKGLALLAVLDGPSGLPTPGGMQVDAAPLTWMADNTAKGISPDVYTLTLHADAGFAVDQWDVPDAERGPRMLKAAAPFLRAKVLEYTCHRWGFTRPVNPWSERCFTNPDLNLALAGDAFGGARVEGAALSGLAAALALLP